MNKILDENKGVPEVSERSILKINTLYPGIRPIAYRVLTDAKRLIRIPMNITDGIRSLEDQLACYQKGREKTPNGWVVTDRRKVVTNAKPGLSFHNYGLAWDAAFAGSDPYLETLPKDSRDALWQCYGSICKMHGMDWGGNSIDLGNGVKDLPHAQLTYGLTIAQLMELWEVGGISAVWAFLDKHRGVPVGQDWAQK